MKKLLFASLVVVGIVVAACGPDWGDCQTCKPGEDSAVSVGGGTTIPVVVVITNTTVNNTPTTPPVTPVPDAGCSNPPVCREVCTCYVEEYVCSNGHTYTDKSKCSGCNHITKSYKQCTKEEKQCR